jgi:ubiquinone/menaquinone biosynthesis C-methylase UbiE
VAPVADERGRETDAALREHYATSDNLSTRRALNEYALTDSPHRAFANLFEWSEDATVLDVGCGDGVWAAVAQRRTPRGAVVGLDFSLGMLEGVARRAPGVGRVQGDANVLPLRDASFDVVIAAWMLYHVDRDRALPEYRRVLRPGGKLLAATNSPEFLPTLDEMIRQAASEEAGHDLATWLGNLAFNSENGEEWLRTSFGHVERIISETPFEVPDATPFLAYLDSVRAPATARLGEAFDYDRFLARVERGIDERLQDGPIRFTRRVAFFVATP